MSLNVIHTIRFRLTVLFIVVTTVTLAAFGGYANYILARELEAQFANLQKETVRRLAISAPRSMWEIDVAKAHDTIAAEMLPSAVLAIFLYDSHGRRFASIGRDVAGEIVVDPNVDNYQGIRVDEKLYYQESDNGLSVDDPNRKPLGKLTIIFSREGIDRALRDDVRRRALEIFFLDLLLVLSLALSLQMVFRPLGLLREALFELAGHDSEDVEELPENRRDEFGDVVRGFNQTQRKVKSFMERRRQAEAEAKASALRAEQALFELQAAQTSLLQSEKMASLGGLVAGVAHEINTPVGITLTSASVLKDATETLRKAMADGAVRKSDITSYLETAEQSSRLIMSNAERAANLIHSFKQVAVDQTSEARREYELGEYIDEVMTSLHQKLMLAHVKVTVDCPKPILLDGYPGAMAQVLTNLAMNAMAHAFDQDVGGNIEIKAGKDGNMVSLRFKDDGRGIPSEHLGKVFDPFFTTRRGQGGTGLGLNIVFNIIAKRFGGNVEVSSDLGKGTCFTLNFPVVSPVD